MILSERRDGQMVPFVREMAVLSLPAGSREKSILIIRGLGLSTISYSPAAEKPNQQHDLVLYPTIWLFPPVERTAQDSLEASTLSKPAPHSFSNSSTNGPDSNVPSTSETAKLDFTRSSPLLIHLRK